METLHPLRLSLQRHEFVEFVEFVSALLAIANMQCGLLVRRGRRMRAFELMIKI